MLFQHTWKYVVSGQKTQTRRPVHEGDLTEVNEADPNRLIPDGIQNAIPDEMRSAIPDGRRSATPDGVRSVITKVIRTADAGVPKTLYQVGQTYSVQPGIAKKTVGNIRITAIRRERLQDLSDTDVLKELPLTSPQPDLTDSQWARQNFIEIWNKLYPTPGIRWEDNPEVWVIDFEPSLKQAFTLPTRSMSRRGLKS